MVQVLDVLEPTKQSSISELVKKYTGSFITYEYPAEMFDHPDAKACKDWMASKLFLPIFNKLNDERIMPL